MLKMALPQRGYGILDKFVIQQKQHAPVYLLMQAALIHLLLALQGFKPRQHHVLRLSASAAACVPQQRGVSRDMTFLGLNAEAAACGFKT